MGSDFGHHGSSHALGVGEVELKQWLGRWLGFNEQVESLADAVMLLEDRVRLLELPKPELTAGDILARSKERKQVPIRIQREPFRKTKAAKELALDPHYQEMQQRIRNEADRQPRSK